MPKFDNIKDQKFNDWIVLEYRGMKPNNRNAFWLCKCKCGIEKEVSAQSLKNNTSKRCVKCAQNNSIKKARKIPQAYLKHLTRRAKLKNIIVDISEQDIINMIEKQNFRCRLSGLKIEFAKTANEHLQGKTTASVDRIDSSKGYIVDNIQIVHKDINLMKNILTVDRFKILCKLVTENNNEI